MFSQPLLDMSELNRPRFLQSTRSESAHPVVMHTQGRGYLTMPANGLFDRFPSLFDSFFNIHAFSVLTL